MLEKQPGSCFPILTSWFPYVSLLINSGIQGTVGCTFNVRVPMVFIVFNLGILGDYNP